MTPPELKKAVQDILPQLIAEDPAVRDFVLRTVSNYYASREETESKFDRVLAELQRDREEQSRKWDEQSRQWDEQSRQWNEQHQQTQTMLAELQDQKRRYESTIGAIGSRWGLYSEESFRSALKGILEESFGVQVLNINDFDEAGEVFGRPDQVELDIVITNGSVIACEIKSSLSKSDMYSFDRKVAFYQKRHERPVSRKLVISPMVDQRARPVAEALGIEIYSSPQSMPGYRYGATDNVL
ncbi:MAG: PD-(D/E)XK nuclease family protein [Nodosilinea sp.]